VTPIVNYNVLCTDGIEDDLMRFGKTALRSKLNKRELKAASSERVRANGRDRMNEIIQIPCLCARPA